MAIKTKEREFGNYFYTEQGRTLHPQMTEILNCHPEFSYFLKIT
jgi:hypothetical protein